LTEDRRELVLEAPIGRVLWSLAWPIALSNELTILTLGVLLFWLGRLANETGLVVESLFRPFGLLVEWLFLAGALGGSVLVSRAVGAKDGRGLTITAAAVTLTLAMWLVFAAIALPLSPWLVSAFAGGLDVEAPLLQFMIAFVVLVLPGISIAELLLEVVASTGNTRFNLVRVLLDLAFMAALTPLLMRGVGLGIAGAPIAQGLAAITLIGLAWVALVRRRALLELGELAPGAWRIRWSLWREILAIGLPVQVGRMVTFGVQMILVHRISHDGGPAVAGYGVAMALYLFGVQATLALAQAGGIVIGQALGAGRPERARTGLRATLVAGMLVMAAFAVATLFDRPIVGLFTDDPAIAAEAAQALAIVRWAGFGAATFQILLSAFAAHRATVTASAFVVGGEALGLVVALVWPGSYLDAACFALVAANIIKAGALLALVGQGRLAR